MKKLYIITGANGHLGRALLEILEKDDGDIRGLVLESDSCMSTDRVQYFHGDVREVESLKPLFETEEPREISVIHTAGIVDISEDVSPLIYDVNVNGTKNIIALCEAFRVKRLIHVSSVHAIPEKNDGSVLSEVGHFSASDVVGGYAKTKAEATQAVLDATQNGLDAVIVHPSGILGPYDERSNNHLVQMVADYMSGKLLACVNGGYDFVDVRDVAKGIMLALEKGESGECYILSNRYYKIKDALRLVRNKVKVKNIPTLPMWVANMVAPLIQYHAQRKKKRPLYTKYSLHTLSTNANFSHDKATSQLGYRPRDLALTMRDTVQWLNRSK